MFSPTLSSHPFDCHWDTFDSNLTEVSVHYWLWGDALWLNFSSVFWSHHWRWGDGREEIFDWDLAQIRRTPSCIRFDWGLTEDLTVPHFDWSVSVCDMETTLAQIWLVFWREIFSGSGNNGPKIANILSRIWAKWVSMNPLSYTTLCWAEGPCWETVVGGRGYLDNVFQRYRTKGIWFQQNPSLSNTRMNSSTPGTCDSWILSIHNKM